MTLGFASFQHVDTIAAGGNAFPIIRDIESEKPMVFPLPCRAATGVIQTNSFTKKNEDGTETTTDGGLTLAVKPDEDISFVSIKQVLQQSKVDLEGWTTSTVTDDNGNMKLKLKVTKEGYWSFTTNLKSNPQQLIDGEIKKGQKLNAVVTPGFWFNPKEKKYGIYFKLTSLMV